MPTAGLYCEAGGISKNSLTPGGQEILPTDEDECINEDRGWMKKK
jgi:hypothetical protein